MSKPAHPLQRHKRRSSTPTSPISPGLGRRTFDRAHRYFDNISPPDGFSATTYGSESPSLDIRVPSPTFDLSAFSPTSPLASSTVAERSIADRSSEEYHRNGKKSFETPQRPTTSGGAHELPLERIQFVHSTLSPSPAYKSPPITGPPSQHNEGDRFLEHRPRFYENNAPTTHSYSTTSLAAERGYYEDAQARNAASKKSRLNLLNPMSLLAKRRSSQNQSKPEDVNVSIKIPRVPDIPADFEPSIRGKIVHDFSAPRTRRLHPQNDSPLHENLPFSPPAKSSPSQFGQYEGRSPNPTSSHSPLFKEHFQDDRLALQPARTNYLHSLTVEARHLPNLDHVPAFARRLPAAIPDRPSISQSITTHDKVTADVQPLPEHPASSPPPPPPPPSKDSPPKGPPSPKLNLPPASALPKHMTSTSSRFSFQLGGQASSAQERLLEGRHKEHDVVKRPMSVDKVSEAGDDPYEDYDFGEDDGLEERIPGVNADYDDEAVEYSLAGGLSNVSLGSRLDVNHVEDNEYTTINQHGDSLQDFSLTPQAQSLSFSPTTTQHTSEPTPRDSDGLAIGIADANHSGEYTQADDFHQGSSVDITTDDMMFYDGLGISTFQKHQDLDQNAEFEDEEAFDESELYFDDGEFDGTYDDDVQEVFDEEMFDDESGRIRDIPAENARKLEAARDAAGEHGHVRLAELLTDQVSEISAHHHEQALPDYIDDAPAATEAGRDSISPTAAGVVHLTEGNLAAYHDALALAATEAAAAGKFGRQVSFTEVSEGTTSISHSQRDGSQAGRVSEEGLHSFGMPSSGIAEDDGFPFGDDMDDDLMIAEANAEALANDDEGIYGQEFGFYARSHGKEVTQLVNGGYFTNRGSNGIKRSHSAKANFQEPSLTPITEKSEWSTRNSIASLQIPALPGSAQSLPSPGIAQLLEQDLSGYEDEMTFSALRKLRRGAFGGSSTSINSQVAAPVNSSPLAHMSGYNFPPSGNFPNTATSPLHNLSTFRGPLQEALEDDYSDEYDCLTLTQNTPRKPIVLPGPMTPSDTPPSYHNAAVSERKKGHSRNSSGAESVSYVMNGDGRWVLERRRTGDSGEIEVVGREFLAGGRI